MRNHDCFRVLAVLADDHIAVVVKANAALDGRAVLSGNLIGIENSMGALILNQVGQGVVAEPLGKGDHAAFAVDHALHHLVPVQSREIGIDNAFLVPLGVLCQSFLHLGLYRAIAQGAVSLLHPDAGMCAPAQRQAIEVFQSLALRQGISAVLLGEGGGDGDHIVHGLGCIEATLLHPVLTDPDSLVENTLVREGVLCGSQKIFKQKTRQKIRFAFMSFMTSGL